MKKKPDFDDIVGTEGSPEELAELRQVHNLLLSAEPPPELPEARRKKALRRRPAFVRTWAAAAFGFAAVLASLTAGLAIGRTFGHSGEAHQAFSRTMHGIGTAAAASAVIKVGSQDASGNRTLRMAVHSLPSLRHGYYTALSDREGPASRPLWRLPHRHNGQREREHERPRRPRGVRRLDRQRGRPRAAEPGSAHHLTSA